MLHDPAVPFSPVEKHRPDHETEPFDCGNEALNRFLKRFALLNQHANTAQTYVVSRGHAIVGYYSLTVGSVDRRDAPERVVKGLARSMCGNKAPVSARRCSKTPCCVL